MVSLVTDYANTNILDPKADLLLVLSSYTKADHMHNSAQKQIIQFTAFSLTQKQCGQLGHLETNFVIVRIVVWY